MTLLIQIMTLLGSVAMLMYGLKVMSEGLQKMAGSKMSNVLGTMTTNRFTGVLTGAAITAAVQSSTATTVMTVSFVSAGILSLSQAISVIMGANIGTTFTAWIMVLGVRLAAGRLRDDRAGGNTYPTQKEFQYRRFPHRFGVYAAGFDDS